MVYLRFIESWYVNWFYMFKNVKRIFDMVWGMYIYYYNVNYYLIFIFFWWSFEFVCWSFLVFVDIIGDGLRDIVRCCLIERVKFLWIKRVILGLWNFLVIVWMLGFCIVCWVYFFIVNICRVYRVRGVYF